ncbi:ABC transporter ATP-binding protein [Actinoplanes cyaneus]|uniref:ABC transporter ATP-binding protein n=1 Tax=Actinoplanes cyaneus TaxID=52696 RepID=A0A919MA51_9ACTN|nr:ABC transporter ATP-binding protein [Actinoplanes cyaneus]MCW2141709.1 putative ABC transport system ATP-binding protein [Actinoplanes cyaneus]GID68209.1 ABC transporter ATP-binding protein [Actinoplanes cyaneus]
MTDHVLEAQSVTKQFPPVDDQPPTPVLRGVSLAVFPGEFVAIVGPSGSGKSTLLYCLSGLEDLTSGEVSIAGRRLSGLSRRAQAKIRRDHVGFIFQSYNLIPSLSAWENVALPARLAKRAISAEDVSRALHQVSLGDRASHKPSALSGGQQQRVAIARVLATRPDIVFADEPTGALDTEASTQVLDLLRDVADSGRSVVMVTHDLQAAARADRVLVLRDGAIHRELLRPTADDVFDALAHARKAVA